MFREQHHIKGKTKKEEKLKVMHNDVLKVAKVLYLLKKVYKQKGIAREVYRRT